MDISTQNKNLSLAEEKEVAILLKGKKRFIPIPNPYRDRLQLLVDSVKKQIRSPAKNKRNKCLQKRTKEKKKSKRELSIPEK